MTKPRIHQKLRNALKDTFVKTQRSQSFLTLFRINTRQKVFLSQRVAAKL